MFENVCSLPLPGDVFAQAVHPTEPVVTVGLYNGRVQCFRLPPPANRGGGSSGGEEEEDMETSILSDGRATIESVWGTKRHKRSCRALGYSPDGDREYFFFLSFYCLMNLSTSNREEIAFANRILFFKSCSPQGATAS